MNEPKRLGRPPKPAGERAVRTTISLTPAEFVRLDAVPGKSRSDRIRYLLGYWMEGQELADEEIQTPKGRLIGAVKIASEWFR
jgi:hypothetical protein